MEVKSAVNWSWSVVYPGFYIGGGLTVCAQSARQKKNFPATPTLISHAPQLKNVRMLTTQCYYNTLVGVVYSLVCNIKKVNDTLRRIYSFSLLDMLVS